MANGDKETKSTEYIPESGKYSGLADIFKFLGPRVQPGPGGRPGFDFSSGPQIEFGLPTVLQRPEAPGGRQFDMDPAIFSDYSPEEISTITAGRSSMGREGDVLDQKFTSPTAYDVPLPPGYKSPPPPGFKFDIDNASAMALMNRIDGLVEKRKEGTITDLERQELLDLNNRLDELTTKGAQGAFSNQALLSLLPQLFSQPMEQSELDRQYAKDMSEYQARQQQIAMQRQRETSDRSNAFQFAKSILPNFDFSGMENELDPKLLPELIRYAMNKAQLSASKQNQRMAQPIVKFA